MVATGQNEDFSAEGILRRIRAEGLRVTLGRRTILDVLFSAGTPLSIEEIRMRAGKAGSHPDFATVFRMVGLLERLGVVQKVNLGRPRSFFELCEPSRHHDHIVCTRCGRVVVLDGPCPLAKVERAIGRRHGFRDVTHSLEFFGRCDRC